MLVDANSVTLYSSLFLGTKVDVLTFLILSPVPYHCLFIP